MKSLEEIIATVSPEAMRAALTEKREVFQKALAECTATYGIEQSNPMLDEEGKKKALAAIEVDIRKWDWAVGEIDKRLEESSKALRGPSDKK